MGRPPRARRSAVKSQNERKESRSKAHAGMRAAALASELRAVPIGGGAVRVGRATVELREGQARCDCPLGDEPVCLHRLIATADAGGPKEQTSVETTPPPPSAERLPAEDLARFLPILDEVDALAAEIVALGLRRAGRVAFEKTRALAARAAATRPRPRGPREAGLGRATRALERLAALLPALAGPEGGSAVPSALAELALLRNLSRALRANRGALALADIAGAPRSEYVEVPSLEVQGLGLEAWIDRGGTAGVTAYVAVLEGSNLKPRRVLARTVIAKSSWGRTFDVRSFAPALAAGPAFAGSGATMRDLARGRFSLAGARVAPQTGRLSGSGMTSAAARPALPLDDPQLAPYVLASPKDAVRLSETLVFDPLGRPLPSLPVALLPVKELAPSDFDPTTQRLLLKLKTAGGARLSTALAFREERALWFDNLEIASRTSPAPRWLCVRLARDGGELVLEPLTAFFVAYGALDLTLDVLGREPRPSAP